MNAWATAQASYSGEAGPDRVLVRGARGRAPGPHYKLSAAYLDGYRCVAQLPVFGIDAVRRARRNFTNMRPDEGKINATRKGRQKNAR